MSNFAINFLQESKINLTGLKAFIYGYMMIPTFKIKFKYIFGDFIKKILKTLPIIQFHFMPVYAFIYITYIKN